MKEILFLIYACDSFLVSEVKKCRPEICYACENRHQIKSCDFIVNIRSSHVKHKIGLTCEKKDLIDIMQNLQVDIVGW